MSGPLVLGVYLSRLEDLGSLEQGRNPETATKVGGGCGHGPQEGGGGLRYKCRDRVPVNRDGVQLENRKRYE